MEVRVRVREEELLDAGAVFDVAAGASGDALTRGHAGQHREAGVHRLTDEHHALLQVFFANDEGAARAAVAWRRWPG